MDNVFFTGISRIIRISRVQTQLSGPDSSKKPILPVHIKITNKCSPAGKLVFPCVSCLSALPPTELTYDKRIRNLSNQLTHHCWGSYIQIRVRPPLLSGNGNLLGMQRIGRNAIKWHINATSCCMTPSIQILILSVHTGVLQDR